MTHFFTYSPGQLLASIGIAYWAILFLSVSFGWLRNDKMLLIHFIVGCVMLYFGIKYFPLNMPCEGNENGAGFLFGPIVFIISYALLRMLYKKIFKFEPDLDRNGYSSRDRRGLNFMDYVTGLTPMLLSSIVNLVLAN